MIVRILIYDVNREEHVPDTIKMCIKYTYTSGTACFWLFAVMFFVLFIFSYIFFNCFFSDIDLEF